MSSEDGQTYWLRTFLQAWFGLMLGLAGMRWFSGKEFTLEVMAVRMVIALVVAALVATFYYWRREA